MESGGDSKFILILLLVAVAANLMQYFGYRMKSNDVCIDTTTTTTYAEVKDSLPQHADEYVIGSISIPVPSISLKTGKKHVKETEISLHDTVDIEKKDENLNMTLDIVQRKYTDDSTYTAYVSGLKYDVYPKLDSILVRQKTVERTITKTIERKQGVKVKIRPAVGAGYGLTSQKFDVWLGAALIVDF